MVHQKKKFLKVITVLLATAALFAVVASSAWAQVAPCNWGGPGHKISCVRPVTSTRNATYLRGGRGASIDVRVNKRWYYVACVAGNCQYRGAY